MRDVSWEFQGFITKHDCLIFASLRKSFPKWLDLDWIDNPKKLD